MTSESYLNTKIDGLDLIIFDLDYTLWPFFADSTTPPFKRSFNGHAVDIGGDIFEFYPEASNILQKLSALGYEIGIASRTGSIEAARDLIDLFGWRKYINYCEIYPSCKVVHFTQFEKQSGIPFDRMLFFDDESRNILDISRLGTVAILVEEGVDNNVIEEGLREFVKQQNKS